MKNRLVSALATLFLAAFPDASSALLTDEALQECFDNVAIAEGWNIQVPPEEVNQLNQIGPDVLERFCSIMLTNTNGDATGNGRTRFLRSRASAAAAVPHDEPSSHRSTHVAHRKLTHTTITHTDPDWPSEYIDLYVSTFTGDYSGTIASKLDNGSTEGLKDR